MKKITQLLLFFLVFSAFSIHSQNKIVLEKKLVRPINKWVFKAGVNFVENSGKVNDYDTFINSFDDMAFGDIPLKIDVEYRFNRFFSFGLAGSLNQWEAEEGIIDGALLTVDQDYFAVDANLKFSLDETLNLFKRTNWFELYLNGGVGYFEINEEGTTVNFGPGINLWFSKSIGISFDAIGKWVPNPKYIYDTGHIQISVGLAFRSRVKNRNKDVDTDKKNDMDNDGVIDSGDNCPNIAGLPTNNGCPIKDTDGDGVIDSGDNCPNIAGLPTNNGCPILDSDKDGVIDSADNCPKISGVANNNGCPAVKKVINDINIVNDETFVSVIKKIEFKPGNYNFTQDSYSVLQSIAVYIKANPNSKYRIEGHTDSTGSYDRNRRLSKTRANAVKNYLIDSGIPKERLTVVGLGETKPITTNFTKKGRAKNRRIEIIKIN